MHGQPLQALGELRLPVQAFQVDVPHAVVEDLPRHAPEVGEGALMRFQEADQIAPLQHLRVEQARVPEDHAEEIVGTLRWQC